MREMRRRKKGNMKRLAGPAILMTLILVSTFGCSTNECYDDQNSLPLAGFYSSQDPTQAISIDSVSILGLGAPGDSILQDSVRTLSQVYLPFRIDQPQTIYEIKYLGGLAGLFRMADTITFNYDIVPMFVSSACGAVYYYKMTSIETTHYFIDSVACPGDVITNANIENLKIYFRTE